MLNYEFSFRIVILLFASSDSPKMQFSKTKLSVLNPMNSLQSNHGYKTVFKMSTVSIHTLAVEYATDNHAVLIK